MSDAFSALLLELYRGSRKIEPEVFQQWVFETVGKYIPIDGGTWVSGVQVGDVPPMHSYCLYKFGPQMIRDYVEIWPQDPLHAKLEAEASGVTFRLAREVDYAGRASVLAFMDKYGVGAVMATRVVDPISKLRTVISFSRRPGVPAFSEDERSFKQNLTPHLIEVWTANRLNFAPKSTDASRQAGTANATAVVDRLGVLHVAEDYFSELLRLEWPDWEGPQLPEVLRPQFQSGEAPAFVGEEIVVAHAGTILDQVVLRIRRKGAFDRLGEREQQIARLISEGLSQKEVAKQCGISPATVNNHMAKVYLKLGIADRSQLGKVLALFD